MSSYETLGIFCSRLLAKSTSGERKLEVGKPRCLLIIQVMLHPVSEYIWVTVLSGTYFSHHHGTCMHVGQCGYPHSATQTSTT
jgi:hypothetical protein